MLFGDVIAIALSIIGFLLSLQGLWLVCQALWPARVEAAMGRCATGGLKCFLVGLPVTFVTVVVAVVVAKKFGTFGQLSGFSLALLYVVYANLGTAGFVTHIGRRLTSPADAERPWKATVRGGAALELAWLIPILGWFGLLPISLILGAGATTLSFFGSRQGAGVSAAAAPLPVPLPHPLPTQYGSSLPLPPTPPTPPMPPLPWGPRSRPEATGETSDVQPAEPAGVK